MQQDQPLAGGPDGPGRLHRRLEYGELSNDAGSVVCVEVEAVTAPGYQRRTMLSLSRSQKSRAMRTAARAWPFRVRRLTGLPCGQHGSCKWRREVLRVAENSDGKQHNADILCL